MLVFTEKAQAKRIVFMNDLLFEGLNKIDFMIIIHLLKRSGIKKAAAQMQLLLHNIREQKKSSAGCSFSYNTFSKKLIVRSCFGVSNTSCGVPSSTM